MVRLRCWQSPFTPCTTADRKSLVFHEKEQVHAFADEGLHGQPARDFLSGSC